MPEPLFCRLLGKDMARLPPVLAMAHETRSRQIWHGTAQITASAHPLARLLCTMMGLPRPGRDVPVTVTFEPLGEGERWCRDFGGRCYESRMSLRDGLVVEAMGPATNIFRLSVEEGLLHFRLVGFRFLGISLPGFLRPACHAVESEVEGRYRFDVPIALPLLGPIIHYTGEMERQDT